MLLGLVDLEAQMRDHAGLALVGDVDDPGRADVLGLAARAGARVLVDLEDVGVPLLGERDRVLGDRRSLPGQPRDLARLRVRPARLDVRRVQDQHLAPRGVGDVRAIAVG
jgi:hypothetical protein